MVTGFRNPLERHLKHKDSAEGAPAEPGAMAGAQGGNVQGES